jgi:hypothetical protein
MSTEESILEKNNGLFQEHPLQEMYVKDKEAIIQCMRDFSRVKKLDSTYIFNMWRMAQKYNCDDFHNIVRNRNSN